MKKFTIMITLAASLMFSCKEGSSMKTINENEVGREKDSMAIAETIHSFYKWYEVFSLDTNTMIDFVDISGKHLSLDEAKMKRYYNHFLKTGFVDQDFITNEYNYYKECEMIWQTQPVDEVPYGLDGDKFFCAQDWEVSFWISAPVKIMEIDEHHAKVALVGIVFNQPLERKFELRKIGGKWLLSKVECYE